MSKGKFSKPKYDEIKLLHIPFQVFFFASLLHFFAFQNQFEIKPLFCFSYFLKKYGFSLFEKQSYRERRRDFALAGSLSKWHELPTLVQVNAGTQGLPLVSLVIIGVLSTGAIPGAPAVRWSQRGAART